MRRGNVPFAVVSPIFSPVLLRQQAHLEIIVAILEAAPLAEPSTAGHGGGYAHETVVHAIRAILLTEIRAGALLGGLPGAHAHTRYPAERDRWCAAWTRFDAFLGRDGSRTGVASGWDGAEHVQCVRGGRVVEDVSWVRCCSERLACTCRFTTPNCILSNY